MNFYILLTQKYYLRNDECALNLTYVLEAIFLHGYQTSSVSFTKNFFYRTRYPNFISNFCDKFVAFQGHSFFSKSSSGTLPSPVSILVYIFCIRVFLMTELIHQFAIFCNILSIATQPV